MQARKQPLIIANNFHPATIEALDASYETTHLWTLDEAEKKAKLAELEGHCVAAASASWATDPLLYTLDSLQVIACFGVGVDGQGHRKQLIAHSVVAACAGTLGA